MRGRIVRMLVVGVLASSAMAQNQPSPEELQRLYQDALNTLRTAQDRKNELATQNQELQKKHDELAAQLADTQAMLDDAELQLVEADDRAFAWERFLDLHAPLRSLWLDYIGAEKARPIALEILGDGTWPFTIEDR